MFKQFPIVVEPLRDLVKQCNNICCQPNKYFQEHYVPILIIFESYIPVDVQDISVNISEICM